MPLNKTTAAYRPEPGSLAYRVIDLVSRNIEDDFTSSDLVRKLDVASNSLSALLATPVNHGLLRFDRNDPRIADLFGSEGRATQPESAEA